MRMLAWILSLAIAGSLALFGFIPGRAQTADRRIWPAEQTERAFAEAMKESGWTPAMGQRYYFVTAVVEFRSFLPIGLNDLQVRVEGLPPGVRTYVVPQFPRRSARFAKMYLDAGVLLEVPAQLDPDGLALGLRYVVISGAARWPQVQATIPDDLSFDREPAYAK